MLIYRSILGILLATSTLYSQWIKLADLGGSAYVRGTLCYDSTRIIGCHDGYYSSQDQGQRWTLHPIKGRSNNLGGFGFGRNSQYLFALTADGVYRSSDAGNQWCSIGPYGDSGISFYMLSLFVRESTVIAGIAGGGLFRSSDNGKSWSAYSGHRPYQYAVHHDTIFTGAADGVWCSPDDGVTWKLIFSPYRIFPSICSNEKSIFASAYDFLYRSDDNGSTWARSDSGLPIVKYKISSVFCLNEYIFTRLTDKRVYFSHDNGASFSDASQGLDTAESFDYFTDGQELYAYSTQSVWACDLKDLADAGDTEKAFPAHFALDQNYPNPFNPFTTIRFELPRESYVLLKLYNLLGQEVMSMLDERRSSGAYTVKMDGSGLSSGVYFYRLEATSIQDPTKSFTQVRKAILIR